jgi:adenosylcobyric acid synthase
MKHLAILGTASDVGKSVVATALCRIFSNAGIDVVPFKAQNMSNNSGVTASGLEMGWAQIVQAQACRVLPEADMNPVLLKPDSDTGAQVVLQGKVCADRKARDYFSDTSRWSAAAFESLERLMEKHDLVVIEGAGSCAEMNLYDRDFVNFRTARKADAAVILVADIDRGGVFAQVAGTLALLPSEDRAMVRGIVVNRFRGDISLFEDGVSLLEGLTGLPVLGVIPYFRGFTIDAEDAVPLSSAVDPSRGPAKGKIGIAALYFPHISNFTDLAPLQEEPAVDLHYLHYPKPLDGYKALILPGSKNVRWDLEWLFSTGWKEPLLDFRRRGGIIMGICGGFQMLGSSVDDPCGVEGNPGTSAGLGLLPVTTVLEREKMLCNAAGVICGTDIRVNGYEIHMGRTSVPSNLSPLIRVLDRNPTAEADDDGAWSEDGTVFGTYFHGFFDHPSAKSWFLSMLDSNYRAQDAGKAARDVYELLADHFSRHLDLDSVFRLVGYSPVSCPGSDEAL